MLIYTKMIKAFLLVVALALTNSHVFAAPFQKPEKVVRICDLNDDEPVRLDPHMQFEERNNNIVNQIFESLLCINQKSTPTPFLAKEWTRLSDTVVQFKLRPGICFHNGEPCDAKAVKFSLERNISVKSQSSNAHMLDSIARIDVVDDLTFNIVTKFHDGLLLRRLAEFGYLVPPSYLTEVGQKYFEKHPVGTGPFRFHEWIRGEKMVLLANPNYWRQGYPKIDRLEFYFADMQKRLIMFMEGKLDFITDFEPSQTLMISQDPENKILKMPSWTALAINFNLRKEGPFQKKKVRQALNYAINVPNIIRYVTRGNAKHIATLSMPEEFGFNTELHPYPFDLKKARELLKEAGYPDGFEATLLIDDIQGGKDGKLAKILRVQLSKIGVRANISGGNGTREIVLPNFRGEVPQTDMFCLLCPDPLGHIMFIEGKVFYHHSAPFSLMNEPKFNRLYDKIITTLDLELQEKLCHKLEELIYDEAYSIFTYQQIKLYALKKKIKYLPHITGMLYLSNIELME